MQTLMTKPGTAVISATLERSLPPRRTPKLLRISPWRVHCCISRIGLSCRFQTVRCPVWWCWAMCWQAGNLEGWVQCCWWLMFFEFSFELTSMMSTNSVLLSWRGLLTRISRLPKASVSACTSD